MKRTPLERYRDEARAEGECTDEGASRSANRHFRSRLRAFQDLQRGQEPWPQALSSLLSHESPWVRYAAAELLLAADPAQAVPTLEELASRGRGFVRTTADILLAEWRKGTLTLPVGPRGSYVPVKYVPPREKG